MEFSARQIAQILHADIEGDPDITVDRMSKIEEACSGSLAFLANPKYTHYLYTTAASIVLVSKDFRAEHPFSATLLRVDNPYAAFATLMEFYQHENQHKTGISPLSFISTSAAIGEDTYVGEFTFIGEKVSLGEKTRVFPQVYIGDHVSIGKNCKLYPGVKIYHDCIIGDDCILHAGSVIGSDGFGFAPVEGENYNKIPQLGNVILEDRVEIGANTVIDRATLGSTIIRKGTKLDNLIQVGHNVEIGENTVIAAQSGIAGSSRIGKNCMFGGQVGVTGHVTIADHVKLAAQSGIEGNIRQEGAVYMGSPGLEIHNYRRSVVYFKNFQALVKRLEEAERKIAALLDEKK